MSAFKRVERVIVDGLLWVLPFVGPGYMLWLGFATVEPERVMELEALAQGNAAVHAVLAEELSKAPSPNNFEFFVIRTKVQDQLIAVAALPGRERVSPPIGGQANK